ncbi:MAG TPA: hypothetical protein PLS90_14560 [Candidatus Sumerlaeota bacterium]|nr:hypothetical protein [Candidatus Sumerlaeota bacterium]HOR27924.1 hypothetical protein [Candidatus Sumerlaeota bacterium]HPK03667.1 hypothetical protein [Candidatus Sumerlaeota bacterium]
MTELGLIHLASAIYLSAVICLAVSVNENDEPMRIVRETLRRWAKFMGIAAAIGVVVFLIG